jgi:tetratricopeptide (TPR) repeat protein
MAEKTINDVSRSTRELFEKGTAALHRKNYDYAIAIFTQILQTEPGLFDCREALRATQFAKKNESSGFFKRILGSASASPQLAKAQLALRSNPQEALNTCEQILNGDPTNITAQKILAEAALAMGLIKTAILSMEIVLKHAPKDQENAARLADALADAGNIERAEQIYAELIRANPNDPVLNQAFKNLAAKRSLREGGYQALEGGQGSYRDILKDKQEAVSLEQENRQIKSEDVAGRLIADYEQRLAQEPNNTKLLKNIAELYSQKKEYDKALEYYNKVMELSPADPGVERTITEITAKKFDHQLASLDPTSPEFAHLSAEIEKSKREFLIEQARKRVERYPNDLNFRFELGVLYFEANRISEAIQEFQKAQNNPNKKIQSLAYLGQCFARRGMNDMAAKTLQNALREKVVFDEEKKELIYALGTVLEKMGKKEEAIEQYKQIYEVDIGFRDVGQKVDAYYAAQQGG